MEAILPVLVAVIGSCYIVSLIDTKYMYLPLGAAVLFPADPAGAALATMGVTFLLGTATALIRKMR